jgi:chemotaxis protein histidine kinase CheA
VDQLLGQQDIVIKSLAETFQHLPGVAGATDLGNRTTALVVDLIALLESVINPDAVIVEGPGYTGPDGRSIMPSYADRLTVAELLDLVAYLQTL